jgi:hypothetical protein
MVIYPNAIVDHHFGELNFFSTWRAACLLILLITVTFPWRSWRSHFRYCVGCVSVCWLLKTIGFISSSVRIIGRVIKTVQCGGLHGFLSVS